VRQLNAGFFCSAESIDDFPFVFPTTAIVCVHDIDSVAYSVCYRYHNQNMLSLPQPKYASIH
jgi:hypothetical protein